MDAGRLILITIARAAAQTYSQGKLATAHSHSAWKTLSAEMKTKIPAPNVGNTVQIQYLFPPLPMSPKTDTEPGYCREVIHKKTLRNGAVAKTVMAVPMGIPIESAS